MKGIRKGTLLTLAVVALLVVGVGTALAAGGPGRGFGGGAAQAGMRGGGYGLMSGAAIMDAAASYIGISEATLVSERHSGKSLAQIATQHGKSIDGLETALVQAFGANLDKAVAAGRLTAAQAAQALSTFKAQVGTMVERTATGPVNGRGGGMMGGFGTCPWAP